MIKHTLYKYGNEMCRKLRTWPLKRSLMRSQAKYITRHIHLSEQVQFLMTLCLDDRGLSRQLLSNDWREFDSTKFLINRFLSDAEIVLDVGANLGYFALIEAKASPNNKVYAVEPVPENFKLLRANVELNELSNIALYNCGISTKSETREMIVPRHRNWATLNTQLFDQLERSAGGASRIEVRLMSLSDFVRDHVKERPTLLRMDVEGFEYNIIMGNMDFIMEYRPKIFLEFHSNLLGRSHSLAVLDALLGAGYQLDAWIMNAEFCGREAIFPPPKGIRRERTVTLEEYRAEIAGSSDDEVSSRDGCMLFLRARKP